MQKPERCKRILELLLKNADGMTGMELARHLNVSSRTIRSDIKMLQELLADQKGRLLAVPNRGYKLLPEDDAEDLLHLLESKGGSVGLASAEEQQNYIISRFLECSLKDMSVTQMTLADEMYVGLSTIKNYLHTTRERFAEYASRSCSIRAKACVLMRRNAICAALSSTICMRFGTRECRGCSLTRSAAMRWIKFSRRPQASAISS